MSASHLLIFNATLQLFVSSLLGLLLLLPMQPWGVHFSGKVKNLHDVRSTHIDWILLALMQYGIALALFVVPVPHDKLIASLSIFGGWMNATPYLVRGVWGINAFSLSGNWKQIASASLGLISVFSILTALVLLLIGLL